MGRGRAKAKQTRVARELKYSTGSLDADALRRELAAGSGPLTTSHVPVDGASDAEDDDEFEDDED